MTAVLSEIHVFPLKSAGGLSVTSWDVGARGLDLDRHWMVVDDARRFLTQRELPKMALISTRLDGRRLVLDAPRMETIALDADSTGDLANVTVWDDVLPARAAGANADAWMTKFLGQPCAVVRFDDDVVREVDPTRARPGDQVGFADGFSLLLAGQASLDALNERLAQPIPMTRFRPNLVVAGVDPFAEDDWKLIRIGGLELEVVKPCARCPITTVDPILGVHGKEPLATLAKFRRRDKHVYFGQNLVHRGSGPLRVGDAVTVLA